MVVDDVTRELSNKANKIKNKAETQLVEVGKTIKDLKETKTRLDIMKTEIDKAHSDLMSAIGSSSDLKVNLVKLDQDLQNIKRSRDRIEAVEYEDAKKSLEYTKGDFEGRKRKTDDGLKQIEQHRSEANYSSINY